MVVDGRAPVPMRESAAASWPCTRQGIDARHPGPGHAAMRLFTSSRAARPLTAAGVVALTLGASNSIYMIMPVQTITWT